MKHKLRSQLQGGNHSSFAFISAVLIWFISYTFHFHISVNAFKILNPVAKIWRLSFRIFLREGGICPKARKIFSFECWKQIMRLLFSENFTPINQIFLVILTVLFWGRQSKSKVFLIEANNRKSEPLVNGNQSNSNPVIIGNNKESALATWEVTRYFGWSGPPFS